MGWENAEGAASVAVNTDLWSGHREQQKPYNRRILAGALIGGAAVGTGKIDLYVGDLRVGTLTVTTAAQGLNKNVDVLPLDINVPAGVMVHGFIVETIATNPVINFLLFDR